MIIISIKQYFFSVLLTYSVRDEKARNVVRKTAPAIIQKKLLVFAFGSK